MSPTSTSTCSGGGPWAGRPDDPPGARFMKRLTVLMIPLSGGRTKEFRLSLPLLILFLAVVLLGYVSVFLSIKGARPFNVERSEVTSLKGENQSLETQVEDLTGKIVLLRKRMELLDEKEREIRKMADMAEENALERNKAVSASVIRPVSREEIDSSISNIRNLSLFYDSLFSVLSTRKDFLERAPTLRPVPREAYISSGFGMGKDPFSGEIKPHNGVDFSYEEGTPVMASAFGAVLFCGKDKSYGNVVRISHGNGFETLYAHLGSFSVRKGQSVKKGEVIGKLGNTGRSIGPHLHYEIRLNGSPVNPEDYF